MTNFKKPTDLDLHCLQRRNISGFSRTNISGSAGQGLTLFIMVFSSPSFLYSELDSSHLCQYNVTGGSITYMLLGNDTEVRRHYKWASVSTVTSRHRHGIYERIFESDLKTQFK